jgi:eukaryotic-like serine/threonine-protein kinase
MQCTQCGLSNPPGTSVCTKCSTPLPLDERTIEDSAPESEPSPDANQTLTQGWSRPAGTIHHAASSERLTPGQMLGDRYEILQLLGEGGMGAVYKARDTELDRIVALKLIRPELARNPQILKRFKQELILARQVTHKNVIRIFDLGQSDGIKFITMDFVEGQDLRHLLLEKGKFPPEQAARIILQICRALEAAHGEGVIHRDLKPQNIMLDAGGRAYVMDFGIARSAYLPGMTQTGALIGTPEYMSPEQGRGEKLTERSDLFSLGIIFYELLTGKSPYESDAPLATLWKRMTEKVTPPAVVDPTLPQELSDIVVKALEIEPEKRFASAREMAQQLEAWLGPSEGSSTIIVPPPRTAAYWKWASAALAVLLVAGVATLRFYKPKPKAVHPPVSVLVADFTNHTGDPIFDDTLEPMFNVALEGASFVNAFSRGDAHKLAQKLPHPTDKLDEQAARLIAVSQGLGAVVTGSLSRRGDGYKLSVEALDARSGNSIADAEVSASNKDALLLAVPKLVAPIRKALGDTTPESVQLAASGPFTVASLEVVHLYSVAMQQQFAGNNEEALRSFSKAAELDPNFARAYSGMSAASANLGRRPDGEKYIKSAMEHLDRMTERERYHTRAVYYVMINDYQKCVEEYSSLVSQYPADRIGQLNLAACLAELRNIPKAVEAARNAVQILPQAVMPRLNLSYLSSVGGDFQNGEREARAALQINPSSEVGYLILAEAQMGQGQMSEATESYHQLEKVSARGASMAVVGLADLAAYAGRFADAVRLLEQGATADLGAKRPERAADKFAALAQTQLLRGQKGAAITAADKASANSQSVQVRFLAGRIFAEAGEAAKVQKLAASLGSELQAEPQAYGKILEGKTALKQGDSRQAIKTLTDGDNLLDTWIGRFELGRAYLEAGLFAEADSEFDRCIKRRGEAMELFMDNVPTYSYFPLVYYYQGRAREGLKSANFTESYRTYFSIRGQAGEDPLLPEIHRRIAQ